MTPVEKHRPEKSELDPQKNDQPSTLKYSEPNDAQRLRDLLLRANLSQRAGARELGVDERTIRYWCAGQNTPPRMAFLALERLVDLRTRVSAEAPHGIGVESSASISFPDQNPRVTPKRTVVFQAMEDGQARECEISHEALQDHFGAATSKHHDLLTAFISGKEAIHEAARKKLPDSAERCLLVSADF
jgi:transcriptional regulator with XRE-family HTH domain